MRWDDEVKKAVQFIPVSDLSQVLKQALIRPAHSAPRAVPRRACRHPAHRQRHERRGQGTGRRDVSKGAPMNYQRK